VVNKDDLDAIIRDSVDIPTVLDDDLTDRRSTDLWQHPARRWELLQSISSPEDPLREDLGEAR
jgi:hypothetical protein